MIETISPEDVVSVWPIAEPELRAACEHGGERTTHDVLCQLVTGNAQLWRVYDAWCVTEIVRYPRKCVANISLFSGHYHPEHQQDMFCAFSQWAKRYGATHARLSGRRGWARYLQDWNATVLLEKAIT